MKNEDSDIHELFKTLVSYFREQELSASEYEVEEAWRQLEQRVRRARMRRRLQWWGAAVTGAVAAAAVIMLWFNPHPALLPEMEVSRDIASYAMSTPVDRERLMNIVPGVDTLETDRRNLSVTCLTNGSIAVNDSHKAAAGKNADGFCQLVVPKGKRAEITFADGSRLMANSNTRVVYPAEFSATGREIFVDGEVYLDVTRNEIAPFTVVTRDFKVNVLGTSFNVMAYEGMTESQVVLVSGKVRLSNADGRTETMHPGQLVQISGTAMTSPCKVDVSSYISWTHNQLIYDDEPLGNVFKRLDTCYGREFELAPGVAEIKVTGKLYLKEDLDAVLRSISFSTPVEFEERGNRIYVKAAESRK